MADMRMKSQRGKPEARRAATRRVQSARGPRPSSLPDPHVETLLSVVTALASEVATLRERLDTHERLAGAKGLFSIADVQNFSPDEQVENERTRWHQDFVRRIFRVLIEQSEELKRREAAAGTKTKRA